MAAETSTPLTDVWRDQHLWSTTAVRLKRGITRWRAIALALTIAGAIMVTAASQTAGSIAGRAIGLAGAAVLAAVPVIRAKRLGLTSIQEWTRGRSASEALKRDTYLYLTASGPYAGHDRDANLLARRDEIGEKVVDLERYTRDTDATTEPVPSVHDVDSYIELRVNAQIDGYYRKKAREMAQRLSLFRRLEFVLALAAAVGAAIGAALQTGSIEVWIAVLTTTTATITAHIAAERYEDQINTYFGTARRLEYLRDRYRVGQEPDRAESFVAACEDAISTENEEWMADLTSPRAT